MNTKTTRSPFSPYSLDYRLAQQKRLEALETQIALLQGAGLTRGATNYTTLAAAQAANLTPPASVYITSEKVYYDLLETGFSPRVYSE